MEDYVLSYDLESFLRVFQKFLRLDFLGLCSSLKRGYYNLTAPNDPYNTFLEWEDHSRLAVVTNIPHPIHYNFVKVAGLITEDNKYIDFERTWENLGLECYSSVEQRRYYVSDKKDSGIIIQSSSCPIPIPQIIENFLSQLSYIYLLWRKQQKCILGLEKFTLLRLSDLKEVHKHEV